jgi:hypothetical protein
VSLDIEAIKRRHLSAKRIEGRTFYTGHVEIDLAACVDEIEHLREELHAARLDVERAAAAENANAQDAQRVREEITAHLRLKAGCYAPSLWYAALTEAAVEIEQGKVGRGPA